MKIHLNTRKTFCTVGVTEHCHGFLREIVVSITGDTEKPSGQGPKEPAVGGPA